MTVSPSLYNRLAYRMFGRHSRKNRGSYFDLEVNLKKGNINVPVDIYVSRMLLTSLLTAIMVAVSCFVLIFYQLSVSSVPPGDLLPSVLQNDFVMSLANNVLLVSFIAGLVSLLVFFSLSSTAQTMYPGYLAGARQSDIDAMLPHAVTFMYAMSKGGMNPMDVFRALSEHGDVYGEVAVEVEAVAHNVDLLGYDPITSMKEVARTTPSEAMKNFLESLASIIESGGDISTFLRSRSQQYHVIAMQEQKTTLDLLGMFSEIYVTAFIAGPLFLITIMVVIGTISATNYVQIEVLIYVIIPVGSIMFMWLLSVIGLVDYDYHNYTKKKDVNEFQIQRNSVGERGSRVLKNARFRYRLKKFLENPITGLIYNPGRALMISIPAAALAFLWLAYGHIDFPDLSSLSIEGVLWAPCASLGDPEVIGVFDDIIFWAFMVAIVPFIIFWEMKSRLVKKIDSSIPEFLKRLASFNESGLTLPVALKTLLKSNLGVLNSEVRIICSDMEWGSNLKEALVRFEYRVNTPGIRRMVTLITRASESTDNIKDALEIAAIDASANQAFRQDRFSNSAIYISIIYISYFVFLYVLYTLSSVFLASLPISGASAALVSSGISFAGISDMVMIKLLFYHSVLIQGLFSGVIAGLMAEGNIYSGLKHSVIMMTIGYAVFAMFI